MYKGVLSTLNTKEFIAGLVITRFNESLSHFSDLEKNNVGQRVVPSPAKNVPPKDNLGIIIKSSFASDTKETLEVKNAICLSSVARSK